MVSATLHLRKDDEIEIYIDKFADEFILTIQTSKGAINFISNNLKDIEEITKKMWVEVKYRTLIVQKEEVKAI
jgi:hypothetical protein